MPPPLVLVSRHSPHKVLLLLVSALLGAAYTFGATPEPSSVGAVQPGWVIWIWAISMLVSGAVGLYASFRRDPIEASLRLEGGAMVLGAAAMLLYSGSLFAYAGERAIGSGVTFAAWAGANLWRWWETRKDLKAINTFGS